MGYQGRPIKLLDWPSESRGFVDVSTLVSSMMTVRTVAEQGVFFTGTAVYVAALHAVVLSDGGPGLTRWMAELRGTRVGKRVLRLVRCRPDCPIRVANTVCSTVHRLGAALYRNAHRREHRVAHCLDKVSCRVQCR